jgi:hypothetical protein
MKKFIVIFFLFSTVYGQTPYVNTYGDSNPNSIATAMAAHVQRLADSLAAFRTQIAGIYATTSTLPNMSGYSTTSHTHAYNTLTGLPTLFTQANADGLYSVLAHTHTFASLTSKPTTLSGYGITDGLAITGSAAALTNFPAAPAGTLTGTTLNSTVVTSSLTSIGTLSAGAIPTTLLTGTVTNAQLAGSIAYSKLSLTGAVLNADLAGSIAYSKLSLSGAILNTDLAGSIDLTTKVTGILPFANNAGTTAATSATTGTMTVSMVTPIITITPTAACTFNATGGVTGQRSTFVVTTSGTTSFVLTFGTNFKSTATLATGTTTAKIFTVSFLCTNGTQWVELSRTTAQ